MHFSKANYSLPIVTCQPCELVKYSVKILTSDFVSRINYMYLKHKVEFPFFSRYAIYISEFKPRLTVQIIGYPYDITRALCLK